MCMSHMLQVTIQPSLDNTQSLLMRPFRPILLCLVHFKLALRNIAYWIRPVTRIVGFLSSRTCIYNLLLIKIDCKLTYIQPNRKLWLGFILFLFFIFYKQRLGLFNFYLRGILFVGPRSPIVLTSCSKTTRLDQIMCGTVNLKRHWDDNNWIISVRGNYWILHK